MSIDPIFVIPRMLPRSWGRQDIQPWCAGAPRPALPIGEVWLTHSANRCATGAALGDLIQADPRTMLGELGRAPPTLRLVFAGDRSSPILSDARMALWRVLEATPGAQLHCGLGATRRSWRCRSGDIYRASQGALIDLDKGLAALEIAAAFCPRNDRVVEAPLARLSAPKGLKRATLMRDLSLSVELWRLPRWSRLEPDGETCHVLVALEPGVRIDGHALNQGEAVFVPAHARDIEIESDGATLLVAYPDLAPTLIWREPDCDPPGAGSARNIAAPYAPDYASGALAAAASYSEPRAA